MGFGPERRSNFYGINSLAFPPGTLIAAPMQFAVMHSANGHGEAVADFPPHRALLRKLDVVRIRRGSPANYAGLRGHEPQMMAVALAYGFANDRDRRSAEILLKWTTVPASRLSFTRFCTESSDPAQFGSEGTLDRSSMFSR
jgi:hypothetical protein